MSKEEFAELVTNSSSISEILSKFGYVRTSGGMRKIIKDRIVSEGLDDSHFKNEYRNNHGKPKYQLNDILVENSEYTNTAYLKKRLLDANLLEYKCDICGNTGEWNGKNLVLQLEHKNGNHNDNRL